MKKNFLKKKLASGLAIALVVASISIPNYASAATATKIVTSGSTTATAVLSVGKAVNYDLNKTYDGTKYSWTVSNTKVASINAKTGVVTAKASGAATITVTARDAKTSKWKAAYKQKVTVVVRATSVALGDDITLATGETKELKAVKTPAKSTDVLAYVSSDESIAKVDAKTGVVTAGAPGEATITVYSKTLASTKNTDKYAKKDTIKVTVPVGITKVSQTKATELVAEFNTDAKDVKSSDFSIVNDTTKQVVAVSKIAIDGKKVTITTFADMTDGKSYTVTYNKKDYKFTATNNEVASLAISTATIPYQTETAVKVSKVDANGVVLATYDYSDVKDSKLEYTISTTQGYTNGTKLVLFKIGDTAKATAIYHTYKYDTNGNEVGAIKTELTITATDKTALTVKDSKYTIAKNTPNWNTLTEADTNKKLAIEDNGFKLFFYAVKSDDTKAVAGDYTFETSDPKILLVSTATGTTLGANLVAVNQGTAYVLVKDKDGKVVYSLAVNIVAKRKAAALVLDKESVTVSNTSAIVDSKDVKVSVKDQYGDTISGTTVSTPALLTNVASTTVTPDVVVSGDTITFKGTKAGVAVTTGTYTYKVTVGDFTRTVTVTVVTPNGSTTYSLAINGTTFDTKFDADSKTGKDVTIQVAQLKGGNVNNYVSLVSPAAVTIKCGNDVVTNASIVGDTITLHALSVTGTTVSKAKAGNYTVEIKFNDGTNNVTLNGGFVITDTQSLVSVNQVKTSVPTGTSLTAAVATAFEFTYEGSKLPLTGAGDITVTDMINTVAGSVYVKTVVVNVTVEVDSVNYTVPVSVTVNNTILFN